MTVTEFPFACTQPVLDLKLKTGRRGSKVDGDIVFQFLQIPAICLCCMLLISMYTDGWYWRPKEAQAAMDIRIFIHHEIWKCQAAIPILVSLDLCTQIFCKKNCLGWNTLTIFCYELVTRTLPISKDLSSLYNTCKSLLLSPMCTNLDLLLRLQQ